LADLLLDTTYLLPAFGVAVRLKGFEERFPKLLERYSVSYNPISLVEAKWIVLKLARERAADRDSLLERYRLGLSVVLEDERLAQSSLTNEAVERVADWLLVESGAKDYFDRTIYATACASDSVLLTEDEELRALKGSKAAPRPSDILAWKDLGP
jgi:hypothetical protein